MICHKLKELRKKRGLTQLQMAQALHKSQNAYSLIELGKSKLDAELISCICNILNITPNDLFNFSNKVGNDDDVHIQTLITNNKTTELLKKESDEKAKRLKR